MSEYCETFTTTPRGRRIFQYANRNIYQHADSATGPPACRLRTPSSRNRNARHYCGDVPTFGPQAADGEGLGLGWDASGWLGSAPREWPFGLAGRGNPQSTGGAVMQGKPILSERQKRAIHLLMDGPIMRNELDRRAGCINAPELVSQLRKMGLKILCTKISILDRDGKVCRCGRYEFAPEALVTLGTWGMVAA